RAPHPGRIEGIALHQAKLSADDAVDRPLVTLDIDALDEDARSFTHLEGNGDGPILAATLRARIDVDEGIAILGEIFADLVDGLFDRYGVVPITLRHFQQRPQFLCINTAQLADQVYLAEAVALPLFQGEGDDEAGAIQIQLGNSRDDTEVRVAFLQVESAQQLAIEGKAIGVINIGAAEEAIPGTFSRRDDPPQGACRKGVVPHEVDGIDLRDRPLLDLANEVDPILVEFDQLGLHRSGKAPPPLIEIEDTLHILLHPGARVDDPWSQFDLLQQRFVLDPPVSFEGDAVDHRVFDHLDDQHVPLTPQGHVREEPRIKDGLQRIVDYEGVEGIAR